MAYMGKTLLQKKEWIYLYVQLIHFAVYLSLSQYVKQIQANKIFLKKPNFKFCFFLNNTFDNNQG